MVNKKTLQKKLGKNLFTITQISDMTGVSRTHIHRMIDNGSLKGHKVVSPGNKGWSYVFQASEFDGIESTRKKSGPTPDNKHIHLNANGRYEVTGTHDWHGKPFSYKNIAVARRRAKEAYQDGLEYRVFDSVCVKLTTKELRKKYQARHAIATLIDSVTHIDKTIVAMIQGEKYIMPRHNMITYAIRIEKHYCHRCDRETEHYSNGQQVVCTACRRTRFAFAIA
jgi:excisionase family DNA binding protein